MRRTCVSILLSAVFLSCTAQDAGVVEQFLDAYNRHDVNAMLALAHTDLRWMSVTGDEIAVEASGHEELRVAMTGYFVSLPSTRSRLLATHRSGDYVTTVEQAIWNAGGTDKSQCSTAVYRVDDGKIADVWYFPAYQCPQDEPGD